MKAKINNKHDKLFTPHFHTAINGQSVRVSKDELVNNWTKYVNGPLGYLYENKDQLRAKLKKGTKTSAPAVVLDMSKAKQRGLSFSGKTASQKQAKQIEDFKAKQAKNRSRLVKKLKAEKAKIQKAAKAATDRANKRNKKKEEAEKATK